ncbi:zinc finger protein 25-like [Drosophila grimshawi]|uniref:zinc finger protein 25-like n=1 Tax=Drosophila grimshawi TaxID=7222 RepID=UPI001C935700|nr:zinc finger protein 25-like [Drosophila grimshawi]
MILRCELCDKSFTLKTHLTRHVRTEVHKRTLQTKKVQNDPSLRLKLKMMQEHSHSKGRPYPCEYMCGKSFATKHNLKNHMLIHSGIRSYRCEICDSSFKHLSHLSTHLRTGLHKRALERFEMQQPMQDETTHQLKLEMNEESLHILD